jgi:LacI family transcriptional regulator
LLQRGYRNISFFDPFLEDYGRIGGVRDALREQGIELCDPQLSKKRATIVPIGDLQENFAYRAAWSFLEHRRDSWGVVAANDHAGHGLFRAAVEAGLKPGRDFGLIGFDDFSQSRLLGMTSMRPPLEEMGEEAARLLIQSLEGKRTMTEVWLRSQLKQRESTMSV